MIRAMREVDPPLVIEDLVHFGEDRGYERGLNEGLERGLNEGLERGLNEGLERGLNEGGLAEAHRTLLDLLETRGLSFSPEDRARIDAERDIDVLRAWLRRAVASGSVREVFEPHALPQV
jgi:hypothetical protein